MVASLPNRDSQAPGKKAAASPIASVSPPASAAPVQATRNARSRRPAPIAVPTMAASGAPKPNTSGTSRHSKRAPVPKPATGAGPKAPAAPGAGAGGRRGREGAGETGRGRDADIGGDAHQRRDRAHAEDLARRRP